MRRPTLLAALFLLAAAASAAPAPARAATYAMEIVVDGRTLPVYPHDGRSYVEALAGHEYSIRLSNLTGERVAVALAVDGLNSIDATHTTARDAQKWILGPWQTVTLPGWQTGSGTARRFVFTSEDRSYGAWLGRTSDLGIVSAAFFRERRRPEPVPEIDSRRDEGGAREKCAQAPAAKDSLAATGIGRQVDHEVTRVAFDEDDAPASVVAVRYEYRDALVRLGVLPAHRDEELARRERARGFESDGFAPDPFRGR